MVLGVLRPFFHLREVLQCNLEFTIKWAAMQYSTISRIRLPAVKIKIKQFMVTNFSKDWPGSIVTDTLKNGILIPIVTSTESHLNADFKYISFIKFSLTHRKLRAWEIILENRGKHPLKVIESSTVGLSDTLNLMVWFFIVLRGRVARKSKTLA